MAKTGAEMLMGALGLDPAKMKESIDGFQKLASTVAEVQKGVDSKLDLLLLKCDQILSQLSPVENPEVQLQRDLPALMESAKELGLVTSDLTLVGEAEIIDGPEMGATPEVQQHMQEIQEKNDGRIDS